MNKLSSLFAVAFVIMAGVCFADCPPCPTTQPYWYTFINLNYSETFSSYMYPGLYVTAPPIPRYNLTWNLTYGQSEHLAEANITCVAPEFPAINKNDTIEPNQTISYVRWNYSVTAAPCPAVQQPTIGEENATVQESELNVTCYAQPTTDLSRNLVYIVASALGLTVIIELVLHFIRSRRKWSPQKRSD